jgi:hypothetical protein
LDDFILLCADRAKAVKATAIMKRTFFELGVELSMEKEHENVQAAPCLGMFLDTRQQELSLPEDKRDRLVDTLDRITHTWDQRSGRSSPSALPSA